MESIFTKIIRGEIPCQKIAEDESFFAFLDIRPISEGHTLVIPKVQIDHFFDIGDDHLSTILVFSKPIVAALEKVIPCKRVGMMVAGLEVPHAHLHLVPIQDIHHLSFAHAKPADQDQLANTADRIKQALNAL